MGGRYEAGLHCWPVIGRHALLPACSLSTACSKIAGMLLVVPAAPSTKLQRTAPYLRCVCNKGLCNTLRVVHAATPEQAAALVTVM